MTLISSSISVDSDWVDPRLEARLTHPAGKRRVQDNQAGAAELLAKITAPRLPTFEEKVHDLMFELANLIVEAAKQ